MKIINIGKFEITKMPYGVYYEHSVYGDEKAGAIYINTNREITDLDGDVDIPLSVLSVLMAEKIISFKTYTEQMSHRYIYKYIKE